MSVYIYTEMIATGNAKILRDFVKYFENDYDGEGAWYAKHEATEVYREFLNDNCYCIKGSQNHFFFDIHRLSREFPTLKFENITECSDGADGSDYSIYINGKQVDYAEGNSSAFGPRAVYEVKCRLCNTSLESGDGWDEELCSECDDFRRAIKTRVWESDQMTENEFLDFLSKLDFLFM